MNNENMYSDDKSDEVKESEYMKNERRRLKIEDIEKENKDNIVFKDDLNEYIDLAILDFVNAKTYQEKIREATIIVPKYLRDAVYGDSANIKTLAMENSVFVCGLLKQYKEYIKEIYGISDDTPEEEFTRKQLKVYISPECESDIKEIQKITGVGNKSAVIRNALEFRARQE
ncbi:MAG: hypothetical protein ACOCQD_00370 [archaeon]